MVSNEQLSHVIPEEYLYDPLNAEPTLDHLRSMASTLVHQAEKDDRIVESKTNVLLTSLPSSPMKRIMDDIGDDGEEAGKILRDLLKAADKDVSIHMARIKAVLAQDPSILQTYTCETDTELQQRSRRLASLQEYRKGLVSEAMDILQSLNENMDTDVNDSSSGVVASKPKDTTTTTTATASNSTSLTVKKSLQERMNAWQRALQLYIFTPPDDHITTAQSADSVKSPSSSSSYSFSNNKQDLTLLQLLQHLCLLCKPEDDNSNEMTLLSALEQAKQVSSTHLNTSQGHLQDAMEQTIEIQQQYHVHLIAHSIFAQRTLHQTTNIQKQYLTFGKEALKIGRALEMAECRRRQCDFAQKLIRRWWFMENLAQQEEATGDKINVMDEVRNVISPASCKMDELFTRNEYSLEASKTLNGLRTIVKCRSTVESDIDTNADETPTPTPTNRKTSNPPTIDPQAKRRFDLTSNLIERTSYALEQRLLNNFSEIYTSSATNYDFSSVQAAKRHGRLDWVELRNISESLMFFDHGKALQELYINLVVSTKIPELFLREDDDDEDGIYESEDDKTDTDGSTMEEKEEDFDIDATRSKLSTLFHRVSEVCTEEFQLIAHVFSPTLPHHLDVDLPSSTSKRVGQSSSFSETYPMNIARLLLQRIINNPQNGMQSQINDLLCSIDKKGDFDSGSKKLDVFVVLHEKAAALFQLLKEAAQKMWGTSPVPFSHVGSPVKNRSTNDSLASLTSNSQAINSLIQFLTSQEHALSQSHRRGYLNLELRLLHHQCCANLDRVGAKLTKQARARDGNRLSSAPGTIPEFRAPIMTLDKSYIKSIGFKGLLSGLLKQSVLRQSLIHAIDSLARARLMYGVGSGGGEERDSTARVIVTIFTQMINFYGYSYLFPIIESLGSMLQSAPPSSPPTLPFDENAEPHNLGVDGDFWISIERIYSFCKSFDRELWAENRAGSNRTWSILVGTRSQTSLTLAKDRRRSFFLNLEERGESVILGALDAISSHIQWIIVAAGQNASNSGTRLLQNFTNQGGGPYAIANGSLLDSTNSPSVKAITFCLRSQFVHIQSALTPQSLSAFWTALSMRLHDILVARLLQHYTVTTVGAVVLSRDVEALRSVSMLAGTMHSHWDNLRELLTLYMTPPDALKTMLVGPDGDVNSGKGMFGRVGKDQSIVFTSRRADYRYNTKHGVRKSPWVMDLLEELGVNDPTDGRLNLSIYAAENMIEK